MNKSFANKGVRRNKKPLKNIYYIIRKHVPNLHSSFISDAEYDSKFKINDDIGYVKILWGYEGIDVDYWSFQVDLNYVKNQVSSKQWSKCMDAFKNKDATEYKLIVQRRIDGKNKSKI